MPTANSLEVTLRRPLRADEVTCPAADLLGGCSIYCGVEKGVLDGYVNPDSVTAFCTGDYTQCPSWQEEKKALAANKGGALEALRSPRQDHKTPRIVREERLRRAQEFMRSNSESAKRFRRRVLGD